MILYFRDQDIHADALKEGIDIGRQEGIHIGRQEGIDIGRQEEAIRIAQSMLEKGMDPALILEMTGLSSLDLDKLRKE